MTPQELQGVRERAEKATSGPWAGPLYEPDLPDRGWWIGNGKVGMAEHAIGVTVPALNRNAEADAKFIAHAREDVPALVAEVERLSRDVADLRDLATQRYDRLRELGLSPEEIP